MQVLPPVFWRQAVHTACLLNVRFVWAGLTAGQNICHTRDSQPGTMRLEFSSAPTAAFEQGRGSATPTA